MKSISSLSLEKHEGPYEKWPLASRLYFNGADTGTKIPGYLIEAQYRCADGYLVITSYDCPHEESNDFVLLDERFDIIAKSQLLVLYGSFLLNDHWPISETALRLHYYDETFYDLSIEDAPLRRLAAVVSPHGVWTKFSRLLGAPDHDRKEVEPAQPSGATATRKSLRVVKFEQFRDDPKCVESVAKLRERLEKTNEYLRAKTIHTDE